MRNSQLKFTKTLFTKVWLTQITREMGKAFTSPTAASSTRGTGGKIKEMEMVTRNSKMAIFIGEHS